MKKITLLAVACVAISLASCKKDRDCECIYSYTSANGTTTTDPATTTTYKKISKGDAKTQCNKTVWSNTNSGGTTTSTNDCKLK